MAPDDYTHIPLKETTRDRVRRLKRGGETYTDLVERMVEQYDPEAGRKDWR